MYVLSAEHDFNIEFHGSTGEETNYRLGAHVVVGDLNMLVRAW